MCIFCRTFALSIGPLNMQKMKKLILLFTFVTFSCLVQSTEYAINHCPVTPVREEPSHAAEQATQLLFGELCEVLERQSSWTKIRSTMDGQVGWVVSKMLTHVSEEAIRLLGDKATKQEDDEARAMLCVPLFEWVIENLCKNAIDSMEGKGKITIEMKQDSEKIVIDITDTGKGIDRRNFKKIFRPGYTSKKRGWGLGLSLAKRIIEDYHLGKLFVKQSQLGVGTTFRIILEQAKNS